MAPHCVNTRQQTAVTFPPSILEGIAQSYETQELNIVCDNIS